MLKDNIIQDCLKKSKYPFIKATDVSTYIKSPFNIWANYFGEESEKDPISDYLRMLFDQGNEHETKIVNERYPGTKKIEYKTKVDGFKVLVNEMFKGTRVFYNLPIYYLPETFLAQPDIIEREDSHKSFFGDYHYVIKEIKLAKNIKKEHIMQACFGNLLLSKVQGYTPNYVYIINKDNEEFQFSYFEYEKELLESIQEIREIINGKFVSPNIGSVSYPWESYAERIALKTKDISLLNSLGSTKKKILIDHGIKNLDDLANLDVKEDIGNIKKENLKKFKMAAKSFLENKHLFIKKASLPEKETEIFLDFESSLNLNIEEYTGDIDYLIGILVRKSNKEEFLPFIAGSIEDEESMFMRFIDFIKKQRDFVIYHYGYFEVTRFNELFKKYSIDKKTSSLVINNMVNIHNICKECVIFPMTSYSLKSIAPYLGFKWRLKDLDAQQSLVLYMDYIKNDDKGALQKILVYNEDDLIATKIVKDFLAKNK